MNRRHFLGTSLGSLAIAALGPSHLVLAQCAGRTEPNIEGPFYRPGAPFRSDLGEGLVIRGSVRDTRCRPLRDAVIDVWQANPEGEYDLDGDELRGQLRTGADGTFAISTVLPGRYRNGGTYRPRHVHVKLHANGRPPLTTQLYFPGDPENDADSWFRPSLLLRRLPSGCHPRPAEHRFDFVL
jgi:protocatechuate 3,4-dioxygenase beta subunit